MHGTRGGLSIVLKFPEDEKTHSPLMHNTFLVMGYKLLVHNNYEFPNEEMMGRLLPVSREYYISVRPTETICSDQVRQLTIEDRQCVFSEERPSPYFPRYSEVNCEYECRIQKMVKACGCSLYSFFAVENVEVCNFTKIPCIADNWGECFLVSGNEIIR